MATVPDQIREFRRRVNGYKLAQILMTAEDLGVFAALGGGKLALPDLAAHLSLPAGNLSLLLNVLAGEGILTKENDTFGLDEEFSFLDPDHPASQNGYIRYTQEVRDGWLNLGEAVRNPEAAQRHWEGITGGDGRASEAFLAAMNANAKPQAQLLAEGYAFDGHRILDVGAGAGTYSIAVGKRFPTSTGILMDLPSMVPITKSYVDAAGLGDRFDVVARDYRQDFPAGAFDDVFIFAVIHQEQEDQVAQMLERAYGALKPGGRLFLSSFFLDDSRTGPPFSAMFAVQMLVMVPSGRTYTYREAGALLEGAGFVLDEAPDIPDPAAWFVGRRPGD